MARNPQPGEAKYFVSNAPENTPVKEMMHVGFSRRHVEKWFEQAKQECGFGAFEVRTYRSRIRHWLCSQIGIYLLAAETTRLRGKIRRSRSSKLPDQPAKCCNAHLNAILFSCNYWRPSINTTNIEIRYPTKANAAG